MSYDLYCVGNENFLRDKIIFASPTEITFLTETISVHFKVVDKVDFFHSDN